MNPGEKSCCENAEYETLYAEKSKPFVYRRGNLILAANPSGGTHTVPVQADGRTPIFAIGSFAIGSFAIGSAEAVGGTLRLGPQSFVVL